MATPSSLVPGVRVSGLGAHYGTSGTVTSTRTVWSGGMPGTEALVETDEGEVWINSGDLRLEPRP